ncbi:MAG: hypothetical protein RL385_3310 [Pseudomonadota bacterium]|jgi:hypothetical protein
MKPLQTSRRMFLRGVGGFTLAIPFLPSLAQAQQARPVGTRFVMVLGKFGRDYGRWYPALPDNAFTEVPNARLKKLSEIQGALSHALGPSFDGLRNKMSILRGLDSMNSVCMHNYSLPTTGCSANPSSAGGFGYSIDCVLEESKKFYAVPSAVGALRTCPHIKEGYREFSSFSYTSKARLGQTIQPDWSPRGVYDRLLNPANVQLQASRNQKIRGATNLVMEHFRQVMRDRRIASDDRHVLDNYMALVSEIDSDLAIPAPACSGVEVPATTANASELHKSMFRLEAAALACGVTRIVMHSITHFDDNPTLDQGVWHNYAHGHQLVPGSDITYLATYAKWSMELVAYFMGLLDSLKDATGNTVLDESVFVYGNEDGSGGHQHYDLPVLVAGAKGLLNLGHLVDYRPYPLMPMYANNTEKLFTGRPYNGLLVTLFKALGLEPAEYQKFGQLGFGRYDQYRKDLEMNYAPFLGARVNDALPVIFPGA